MGIFDRIAGKVEQGNVEAVYVAELQRLDARIAEHTDLLASLRAKRALEARKGDGHEAGYDPLIAEADALLAALKTQRRKVDQERLAAPAHKAVAEARIAVDDQSGTLGTSATAQGLGRVRDAVDALNRRASPGYLDADGIPIHGRQAKLGAKSAEERARAELAQLKVAMGLAPAEDPTETEPPEE
ncbi:MAG: hypothetical protein H6737_19990 [Alphaproteobacteria bacterium]|nr:hypothetical protein [Alphaproteobacteria bacterium]